MIQHDGWCIATWDVPFTEFVDYLVEKALRMADNLPQNQV
jgi:hypothetical protein